jgi:hypothetical protein
MIGPSMVALWTEAPPDQLGPKTCRTFNGESMQLPLPCHSWCSLMDVKTWAVDWGNAAIGWPKSIVWVCVRFGMWLSCMSLWTDNGEGRGMYLTELQHSAHLGRPFVGCCSIDYVGTMQAKCSVHVPNKRQIIPSLHLNKLTALHDLYRYFLIFPNLLTPDLPEVFG